MSRLVCQKHSCIEINYAACWVIVDHLIIIPDFLAVCTRIVSKAKFRNTTCFILQWTIEWDQLNVFFLIIIDNFLIILFWLPGDMKEMFRLHDNAKSDRLWPQSRLVNYLTSSFKLLNPFVWQQKFAKASLKNSASAKYFLAHNAYKTWKWGRIFSFHTYRQEQYMKISLISNQERF